MPHFGDALFRKIEGNGVVIGWLCAVKIKGVAQIPMKNHALWAKFFNELAVLREGDIRNEVLVGIRYRAKVQLNVQNPRPVPLNVARLDPNVGFQAGCAKDNMMSGRRLWLNR